MSETGIEPRPAAAASENSVDRALCASAQAGGEGILGETPRNHDNSGASPSDKKSVTDRRDIFRALEVVERDSAAIAESYASLFSTLRLALSEVTRTSVENMQCFSDVVGSLQVSALDAATKGNRYINSCLSSWMIIGDFNAIFCVEEKHGGQEGQLSLYGRLQNYSLGVVLLMLHDSENLRTNDPHGLILICLKKSHSQKNTTKFSFAIAIERRIEKHGRSFLGSKDVEKEC